MPKFFREFDIAPKEGDIFTLTGDQAAHLRLALRAKVGQNLTVGDGAATDCLCRVTDISAEQITLQVLSVSPVNAEPAVAVTLFVSLTKGDKFEFVIQKSVELGAVEIVPVLTARCISRPNPSDAHKKVERYNKIALAAAKQSGRGIVPTVSEILPFRAACEKFCAYQLPLLAYENCETPLSEVVAAHSDAKQVAVFIGPEGGFDAAEVAQCVDGGAVAVSLGRRILRAETAPIAVLAALAYALGEM